MDKLAQAQQDGVVIGLKDVAGVVARLDIDDLLLHKPDTFNLFLLALTDLQNSQNTADKMGFYQLAGIHGLPRSFWDGESIPNKDPNNPWQGEGYCAHSTPTFPTWHRPYLAIYEQTIYAKMAAIAELFPDSAKPKYRAALQDFRLPYWDYYRPRGKGTTTFSGITGPGGTTSFNYDFSLPQIFTVESVRVRRTSDDELDTIDNPLRTFGFPNTGGFSDSDWDIASQQGDFSQQQTVRYPTSENDVNGNIISLNSTLNKQREPNTIKSLNMISDPAYNNYATFASNSATPGASGNLEGLHGSYHIFIGGPPAWGRPSGHMGSVPVAAFDPVFWIHHCQIDRLFAIWQAAHPGQWFDGDIADLSQQDALPFRYPQDSNPSSADPSDAHWNADLSRSTETFGYSYAGSSGSPSQVINGFLGLYTWSTRQGGRPFGTPPASMAPLDLSKAQVYQYTVSDHVTRFAQMAVQHGPQVAMKAVEKVKAATGLASTEGHAVQPSSDKPAQPAQPASTTAAAPEAHTSGVAFTNLPKSDVESAPKVVDESKYSRDWYVDNIVERLALNGSFTIYYFIGKFEDHHSEGYALQPTMAGLTHIFTSSREACDNCGYQMQTGHEVTDTQPITPMLLDYIEVGELHDLTPANVVPFLIKNLKWRIVTTSGQQVDPRTVAGFKVGVSSKLAPLPPATGEPVYQEYPQVVEQIIANASSSTS